ADSRAAQTLGANGAAAAQGAVAGSGVALGGLAAGVKLVQGVPERGVPNVALKYLVETNPVLTDLKQFLSSDYMLGQLDVKPDQAIKRLGDGLYEQRLIREAVVARTGQRYIDGMTSDETLFRYLMDNAIASKDKLSLSVGVSLSAEQVAALTHDIVWMEQVEVNGEKVLAPVLYLAHANGRVAPNGALIQGRDVNLISGGELVNVGTLRASNNLAVSASNIGNAGLMEAGGRLDMLATESIRNAQGGIIAGREVSLTALTGDVINERSVTRLEGSAGGEHVTKDLVDTAARIEAANNLTITAGQDIGIVGGAVQAGGNIDMDAGRDLIIASQEGVDSHEYQRRRVSGYDTSITQYGSEVKAGGDLTATAGQDLSIVASEIEARRDLALQAGRDVTLAAAANEEHSYAKGKKGKTKYERQEDDVEQQSAEVKAGGDLTIDAGRDLRMVASKASAGDEAYLVAGDKLELLAANDSQYSLYDMNKKGGWGSKKTQRDEVTDVKAVGSEVTSGGDLTLESGGDQLYQGAKLASGADLTIDSGGSVTFEAVKDMHQESHEKSKSDLAWTSAKGKGSTDETLRQTLMVTQGELAIRAAGKINIDIKQIDQNTVSQTIDAMVRAEPQLAWIKQAEASGKVDWRVVKEIHDSWDYKNSGLGAAPALIISIVTSVYLGPLAGAMASNFAVGTINGGGDIGAGLTAATSSKAIKGYATQMVTSGILSGIDTAVAGWNPDAPLVLSANGINNPGYSSGMLDWNSVSQNILRSSTHALVAGSVNTAINGGSFKDNLGAAAVSEGLDLAAAFGNKQVGDLADYLNVSPGSAQKILMHAVLGGALSSAKGGNFKTGALAGAAAQGLTAATSAGLGEYLDSRFATDDQFKVATAQIIGVLAGALGNGNLETASWVAGNAQRYNDFLHPGGNWGAEAASLGTYMAEQGKTPHQISDALQSLARSDGYKGPGHDYVAGWVYTPAVLGTAISPPAGLAGAAMGGVIGGGANISYQLTSDKPFSYVDAAIATTVGGATQGRGVVFTIGAGTGGAFLGGLIKGDSSMYPVLGAAIGGAVGLKTGQVVTGKLKPYLGSNSEVVGASLGSQISEATGGKIGSMGESK
ncbi:DUF637 domain-containing protein, partial [Pseudomonas sp. 1]|uniref:DUF637 domain-containing protein n=1 Tax=Pseudomonas sp. 1 TaxID=488747 RepID=UPI00209AB106